MMDNPRINQINTAASRTSARNASSQTRQGASMATGNRNPYVSSTPREVGHMSDYGVARGAYELREGDVVKGEISDLRNNEITITLEDNTIVKGQIADTSRLSIGQTGSFRLDQISPKGIVIACTPDVPSDSEQAMISKALDEAGLPATERNQSAVKALIDNLLPINKQAITHLMQQAYDFDTEDMSSLAIMNKQMMTINADTVKQFSNYRNGTHQLLNSIQDFSEKLPSLLDALSSQGSDKAVSVFGEKLLSIFNSYDASIPDELPATISSLDTDTQSEIREMLSQTPMTEDIATELSDGSLSLRDALTIIRDSANAGTLVIPNGYTAEEFTLKLQQISQVLEPAEASQSDTAENSVQSFQFLTEEATEDAEINPENTASIQGVEEQNDAAEDASPLSQAGKFFRNLTENAKSSLENTMKYFANPGENNSFAQNLAVTPGNTAMDALLQAADKNNYLSNSISQFLDPAARNSLAELLKSMSVNESLCAKVIDGSASAKDLFQVIKNVIPLTTPSKTCALFQNNAFQSLFSQQIIQCLTVTPEGLAKKPDMDFFFNQMEMTAQKLENLISSNLSGDDSDQMSRQSHDMQSNIEFMKTLNETFSYMQLPLRLRNQTAHGDLYVYSKKEKLKQNSISMSVLLHLNMSHLGMLDVKLAKKNNMVTASFLLDDVQAADLIRTNTKLLENALAEKGFSANITVGKREQNENPVKDFLERKVSTSSTNSGELKRYSFDIRA